MNVELVMNRKLTFSVKEMNMELIMNRKLIFLMTHNKMRFGKEACLVNISKKYLQFLFSPYNDLRNILFIVFHTLNV